MSEAVEAPPLATTKWISFYQAKRYAVFTLHVAPSDLPHIQHLRDVGQTLSTCFRSLDCPVTLEPVPLDSYVVAPDGHLYNIASLSMLSATKSFQVESPLTRIKMDLFSWRSCKALTRVVNSLELGDGISVGLPMYPVYASCDIIVDRIGAAEEAGDGGNGDVYRLKKVPYNPHHVAKGIVAPWADGLRDELMDAVKKADAGMTLPEFIQTHSGITPKPPAPDYSTMSPRECLLNFQATLKTFAEKYLEGPYELKEGVFIALARDHARFILGPMHDPSTSCEEVNEVFCQGDEATMMRMPLEGRAFSVVCDGGDERIESSIVIAVFVAALCTVAHTDGFTIHINASSGDRSMSCFYTIRLILNWFMGTSNGAYLSVRKDGTYHTLWASKLGSIEVGVSTNQDIANFRGTCGDTMFFLDFDTMDISFFAHCLLPLAQVPRRQVTGTASATDGGLSRIGCKHEVAERCINVIRYAPHDDDDMATPP